MLLSGSSVGMVRMQGLGSSSHSLMTLGSNFLTTPICILGVTTASTPGDETVIPSPSLPPFIDVSVPSLPYDCPAQPCGVCLCGLLAPCMEAEDAPAGPGLCVCVCVSVCSENAFWALLATE